jgi:hypothetical protein
VRRIAAALLFAVFVPLGAFAQQDSAPAHVEPIADVCPIAIVAILLTSTVDNHATAGQDFKAFLSSTGGPGVASGTIWINASGIAYHVSFKDRRVLSKGLAGAIDAIVFHLPQSASLENAFVDTLDNPTPGACRITSVWSPAVTHTLKPELLQKFDESATTVDAIEAKPIDDPRQACHSPPFPPQFISVPDIETPRGAGNGEVHVLIALGADSLPLGFTINRRANAKLDAAALRAARASQFRTEIINCRPVAAKYNFVLVFKEY